MPEILNDESMDSSPSLEELCQRLKASDRKAFEQVFRMLREELLRYVRSIVSDEALAHDLVQDVFVDLWGLHERLDPTKPLKAYLYRMARNRALRHLRDERNHAEKHAQLQQSAAASTNGDYQEAELDGGTLAQRLRLWIVELPERQREALILSRYHAMSHKEIASVMGVSPRTVNNHIMRALEHLQKQIQAYEPSLLQP